jgi:hypothetical protein
MDKAGLIISILTAILGFVGAVFSAIGFAQVVLGYDIPWQWIAIGGFIAFVSITRWRIKRLESSRPSMEVNLENERVKGEMCIHVKNNGAKGIFSGQIEIMDSSNDLLLIEHHRYDAVWLGEITNRIEIFPGHTKTIKLASFEHGHTILYTKLVLHRLGKYEDESGEKHFIEPLEVGNDTYTDSSIPTVRLRVIISSEPPALEGNRELLVDVDTRKGISEVTKQD